MDIERFRGCCQAYGASRQRWPAQWQALYDAGAATPQGAAWLAAAYDTDALLQAWQPAAPDAALHARILAQARGQARPARDAVWVVPAVVLQRWHAGVMAALVLLAFAIGFGQATVADDDGFSAGDPAVLLEQAL